MFLGGVELYMSSAAIRCSEPLPEAIVEPVASLHSTPQSLADQQQVGAYRRILRVLEARPLCCQQDCPREDPALPRLDIAT